MEILNVVQFNRVPILQQLKWEEALLRADHRNWCLINQGSPPAIVMGISGKIAELVDRDKLQEAPLPVIRRFSGGGTVVVDENTLFITFICNAATLPIAPYPLPIMRWTQELYEPVFHPHSFQLRENDYVIGHKKFGGNAQSIVKNRWLHHSSLLWDYSSAYMDYLLMPPKMPTYREKRSHADFLCCLKDLWPSPQTFQTTFLHRLAQQFTVQEQPLSLLTQIAALPHRQATEVIAIGKQ
ncbi:putative lipoate-protein ligase A [Candidatus Protochlamydia naegleriophila]|uniref:Putative lipoate-protein ligase A n=1 Tax=Candidatus Protochlamydia naegleriophila TaxID=389348 RepID=A0A0U5JF51_9BACT|nr:lipoate--protein ligase family protein [Candidatus Protochlamydia naegleriophila]CUI17799.1 putative lipoate-protein ligase A [Candidatus Protochlamydia naegleriophila]